jgi:hypothetical protein
VTYQMEGLDEYSLAGGIYRVINCKMKKGTQRVSRDIPNVRQRVYKFDFQSFFVLKLLQQIKMKFNEGKKGRHPFFCEKTIPTSW